MRSLERLLPYALVGACAGTPSSMSERDSGPVHRPSDASTDVPTIERDAGADSAAPADTGETPSSAYGTIAVRHGGGDLAQHTAAPLDRLEAIVTGNATGVATIRWFVDAPSMAGGDADGDGAVFSPRWPGGTGVHSIELAIAYDDGHVERRRFIVSHTFGPELAPPVRMPDSPWRALVADARPVGDSDRNVARIAEGGGLSSSPDTYTYPVYIIDPVPPGRRVGDATLYYTGFYRNYVSGPERPGEVAGPGGYSSPLVRRVDLDGVGGPPAEDEGQAIFWDLTRGEYWAFWRYERGVGRGHATFENGYHYGTGTGYDGSVDSRSGRGAGTSKLVGLVMRDEVDYGVIAHALDFATPRPAAEFVAPALKSDGGGSIAAGDPPEGARFVLDPSLDVTELPGLSREGRMIALALQRYGMFLVDGSGRNKIFVEATETAEWGVPRSGVVSNMAASTVAAIPIDRLVRVH